jgi:hypothetical protein
MAQSSFKYCSHRDVKDVYPNIDEADDKVVIRNWVETGTSNLYLARNTGLVSVLFQDGEDLGTAEANSGVVNANGEWYYESTLDTTYVFNSASNPNDLLMEAGEDWATLVDRMIVNCSMELSGMLDARFPRPIPKAFQYAEATDGSDTPEYDYILKRTTALLVAHHLLVSKDPRSEEAIALKEEIDSIIDRLNKGNIKLGFEIDSTDSSGDIIEVTRTGSMYLVETEGEWHGEDYDRIKVKCTTGGVYGTAKVSVFYYGQDKLYGTEKTNEIVTGTLDHIAGGLRIRFEGNSMSVDDEWHIIVRNFRLNNTNAGIRTIKATHSNRTNKLVYTKSVKI